MYKIDIHDLYDKESLEDLYFCKGVRSKREESQPNTEIQSDLDHVLSDFLITAEDPDVVRYQRDIMRDVDSSGALKADIEFDSVKMTRADYSTAQIRNNDIDVLWGDMDPESVLIQLEDRWTIPDGLDEYMESHGYSRPFSEFNPRDI